MNVQSVPSLPSCDDDDLRESLLLDCCTRVRVPFLDGLLESLGGLGGKSKFSTSLSDGNLATWKITQTLRYETT